MKKSQTTGPEQFDPYFTDILHIRKATAQGCYELTLYPILPGIVLSFNDIYTSSIPVDESSFFSECLLINTCLSGRCEFCVSEDNYGYVDNGLSSISAQMARGGFYYPSARYEGYEIYILFSLFTPETQSTLALFGINASDLRRRYEVSRACTTPKALQQIWEELYRGRDTLPLEAVRLKALQVLQYLSLQETLPPCTGLYLTKTQAMLAKKLEEQLTRDLSRHLAVRTVAASLGVSETGLKNYFRLVYGANVSDYLHTARMKLAARLLAETGQSIAAIARQCGYVNQGRFAGVFYQYYHIKPLDYRRRSRLEGSSTNIDRCEKA